MSTLVCGKPVKVHPAEWCNADCFVYKYSISWNLQNLHSPEETKITRFTTDAFDIGMSEGHKLRACIDLYPKGVCDGRLAVYLRPLLNFDSPINGKLKVTVSHREYAQEKKTFITPTTFVSELGWGVRFSPSQTRLFHLNFSIDTIIRCTISHEDYWMPLPSSEDNNTLPGNLRQLLVAEEHSDVILKVNGAVLKAHKAILASRSTVFNAMLKADMSESKSGEIVIEDLAVDVMKSFLSFLYTGKVEEGDLENVDMMTELLRAADKYDIPDLKVKYSKVLARTINIANAARLFHVAILHNVDQLKADTECFIRRNVKAVSLTDDWKLLKRTFQDVLIESFIEGKPNAL